MKKIIIVLMVFFSATAVGAQTKKPNIVVIFADDLGYKDCGYTGSSFIETPNIDALAKAGMVFNNAYAGAGNCAPSRACLISGLYTPRHGVFAVGSTSRGPVKEMKVVPVDNTKSLAPSFVTVAEALKDEGYQTAIFGKWHLGTTAQTSPLAQGFDVYIDARKSNPNKKWNIPDDPKGMFTLTTEAINYMKAHKDDDKPFFAYLAHHAIHSIQEARPATLEKYKAKGLDKNKALYAACTSDFDETVGTVIKFLKQSGLDKNTLVIFSSDNGAINESPQEPLRGNKGCYYEGGIREPFIAYWPDKIKAGTLNSTPIINLDFYPTFLALADAKPKKLDGENLLPLFMGKSETTTRKAIFWHFPGYLNKPVIRGRDDIFRSRPVSVIRKGDWKLMLYYEEWINNGGIKNIAHNNAVELYNLKDDIGERDNLANKNPKMRDELLKDLLAWLKHTKAPLPTKITATNKPVQGSINDNEE
ncbi:sulfatase [Pedobacter sp. SD-b]|uniref:Sulfatase n=1 Tax=Pedobacter segetis TaxID=2793069 RepID=A0ABS1BMC1_9SPHI|nr:sulfatase [Pedobacter segetis]MBK0384048.1 sulfatase [Pedobacter segetis]